MSTNLEPTWYWSKGLHDATITKQEHIVFATFSKEKYYQNCLKLYIDAQLAMFDRSLSAIKMFNYKILSEDFDLSGYWWVSDALRFEGSKYILKIVVQNPKEKRTFLVRFTHCEVEHTKKTKTD